MGLSSGVTTPSGEECGMSGRVCLGVRLLKPLSLSITVEGKSELI